MKVKLSKMVEVETKAKVADGFFVAHYWPLTKKSEFRHELSYLVHDKDHLFFDQDIGKATIYPTLEEAEAAMGVQLVRSKELDLNLTGLFIGEVIGSIDKQ